MANYLRSVSKSLVQEWIEFIDLKEKLELVIKIRHVRFDPLGPFETFSEPLGPFGTFRDIFHLL